MKSLIALALPLLVLSASPSRLQAGDGPVSDAAPTWVVAELFTSQGCSSCPPADEVLADLDTSVHDGVGILPLAFHVDYWDDIGWPDPFASKAWSARQLTYARAAGGNRIYTPQLVVNGHDETVGSDRRAVNRLLEKARQETPAVRLSLAVTRQADTLDIAVAAAVVDSLGGSDGLELLVAVVDGGHVTKVERGENRRRTLRNEHVVRHLDRVGQLAPTAGGREQLRHEITIDPRWSQERLQVVVLAQDPRTRIIHGAARWVDNREPV